MPHTRGPSSSWWCGGPHDRKVVLGMRLPTGASYSRPCFPSAKSGASFQTRVKTWLKLWHAHKLSAYIHRKNVARYGSSRYTPATKLGQTIELLDNQMHAMLCAEEDHVAQKEQE